MSGIKHSLTSIGDGKNRRHETEKPMVRPNNGGAEYTCQRRTSPSAYRSSSWAKSVTILSSASPMKKRGRDGTKTSIYTCNMTFLFTNFFMTVLNVALR